MSSEHEEKSDRETMPPPASLVPKPEAGSDKKGASLNIRVVGQDGSEVFFRIRENTPLGKLMDAYCDRQSIARGSVRFMFDGERISDDQTPAKLDMEDNDVLDAMLQQVGG